jgi:hypothetical protein
MSVWSAVLGPVAFALDYFTQDENGDGIIESSVKTALMAVAGLGVAGVGAYMFVNFAQAGNVGALVGGTMVGGALMTGGGAIVYSRFRSKYWPELPPTGDVVRALVGPLVTFEGAVLMAQGAGFTSAISALGLINTQNLYVEGLGAAMVAWGALTTVNVANQFYQFLPYGWSFKAGEYVADAGACAVLVVIFGTKVNIFDLTQADLFDLAGFLVSVGGLAYTGYKVYYEWMRYKGYVVCPQDKKKYYLSGGDRIDTYDPAIIKLRCDIAGLSAKEIRDEYFNRMKALKDKNHKDLKADKNKYENPNAYLPDCKGKPVTWDRLTSGEDIDFSCYVNGTVYKQQDSTTTSTQNTTGSGLNTGNAKKAGKGK